MSEARADTTTLSDFRRTSSLWSKVAARLRCNRVAMAAAAVIFLLVVAAIVGPLASPYGVDALDWDVLAVGPFGPGSHWLGTDRLGRDLFVRICSGLRLSLLIRLGSTAISLALGDTWGAVAGFTGGRTDELMMRFVDILYSLPYLFIVIILTTLFDRGCLPVLLCSIGAVGWLTSARVVRWQTLSLARREFIEAALATGASTPAILLRHVIPNLLGPVVACAGLTIPQMILFESFLSFLGLGVQEPLARLGSLINDGAQEMQSAPWMLLVPTSFLVALLMCFNLLGDALSDALDPRDVGGARE